MRSLPTAILLLVISWNDGVAVGEAPSPGGTSVPPPSPSQGEGKRTDGCAVGLLVSKGDERIDACGASCRDVYREQGYRQQ